MESSHDQTFNALQPTSATVVNRGGAYRAQSLIRAGHSDKSGSFTPPSAAAQDAYVNDDPGMLGSWFLGSVSAKSPDDKELFDYPFSSDFKTVSRQALVEARARATQVGNTDIAQAADKLLQIMDGNTIPLNSGVAGLSMTVKTAKASFSYESFADDKSDSPYGDVPYADPGFIDKQKRYPIDCKHVKAAHSYFSMPKNYNRYTPEQRAHIKGKIDAAYKKCFGEEPPSEQKK